MQTRSAATTLRRCNSCYRLCDKYKRRGETSSAPLALHGMLHAVLCREVLKPWVEDFMPTDCRSSSRCSCGSRPALIQRQSRRAVAGATWRLGSQHLRELVESRVRSIVSNVVRAACIRRARAHNEEAAAHGGDALSVADLSRFWCESFQNSQSEFMSLVGRVVLSIFLRQRGSPESKPMDAARSLGSCEACSVNPGQRLSKV
jgi:hypothetical protein